jgi:hypothetical protein
MADAPAISVVTIVHDGEAHLDRAMRSVIGQDFGAFEYIVVDDGSTDGTAAIVETWRARDPRILPIRLERNLGRSAARNRGLDAARGDYLLYLDADDYLGANVLGVLHQTAKAHDSDVVYAATRTFDLATGEPREHFYTDDIVDRERLDFRLQDHLPLTMNHQVVGRLYRRAFLEAFGIRFHDSRRYAEDVPFAFYTAFHARHMAMLPNLAAYFYRFGNTIARADPAEVRDARDSVLETIRFARRHGSPALQQAMLRKGAVFAGQLTDARRAFAGDDLSFWDYVDALAPLVRGIAPATVATLPLYFRTLASALASGHRRRVRAVIRLQLAAEQLLHQSFLRRPAEYLWGGLQRRARARRRDTAGRAAP